MSIGNIIEYLKGPGLSGVILAVGVISAFSLYATLNSEELLPQDEELKQEISVKEDRIEVLEKQLEKARSDVAEREEVLKRMDQLDDARLRILEIKDSNEVVRSKLASLAKGVEQTGEMFESYRQRYRTSIRKAAVGTELAELATLEGETYREVKIRSVGPLGMSITHKEGSCRIPYKELPMSMQQLYQFDAEEAEAKQRAELERLRKQRLASEAAELAMAQKRAEEEQHLEARKAEQVEEAIDEMEDAIDAIERKLTTAKRNLGQQSGKAISRAPQYRQEIADLEKLKDSYQARLRELRAMR